MAAAKVFNRDGSIALNADTQQGYRLGFEAGYRDQLGGCERYAYMSDDDTVYAQAYRAGWAYAKAHGVSFVPDLDDVINAAYAAACKVAR